jgi:hypothetical protein
MEKRQNGVVIASLKMLLTSNTKIVFVEKLAHRSVSKDNPRNGALFANLMTQ